jgi:hypothetical protein
LGHWYFTGRRPVRARAEAHGRLGYRRARETSRAGENRGGLEYYRSRLRNIDRRVVFRDSRHAEKKRPALDYQPRLRLLDNK